ncbi:MAG: hypothetical protein KC620_13115 [Myxococcales bacterium]|nr:hypothetical protein [Myxococcales bacterium]
MALAMALSLAFVACDDANDPETEAPDLNVIGQVDMAQRDRGLALDQGVGEDAAPQPDSGADVAIEADMEADAVAADAIVEIDAEPDAAIDVDAAPEPDAAPVEGPARYPTDQTQSPITPHVAANLRAIADRAPHQDDVFAKVGASATASLAFLHCFGGNRIDLDGRDALQPTLDAFRAGDAAGDDPFSRTSLCATVGWSAGAAISGDPSPLQQEVDAIDPRFAVIMYGTNDIEQRDIDRYGGNLLTLVDTLTEQGIIPVISSVMPRDDNADSDALVPSYNAVVRGVAESRQIPFIDFYRELLPLPDHGLGDDMLHPSAFRDGGLAACVFTDEGLSYGYNIRNLITLQALDRARRIAVLGEDAFDPPQPEQTYAGTAADPIRVTALPYADVRDTRMAPQSALDVYPGCDAPQDESGGEFIYRLDLDQPAQLRVYVIDRGSVDIDVHLLGDPTDPQTCLNRAHTGMRVSLDPGTWYFSLDTFVNAQGPQAGEFMFVLVADP